MKESGNKAAVVICGAGSLNLLRCFAKEEALLLVASPVHDDYTFHSRYCHRKEVVAGSGVAPQQFICNLVKIGESLDAKAVLVYGDDATLLAISRHREKLEKCYSFLMPEAEMVEDVVDKIRFDTLARRLGLPVPRTILSSEIRTVKDITDRVPLPCVLKPNVHIGWRQSRAIQGVSKMPRKVLHAKSPEELSLLHEKMREFTPDFVVQEYVPGGPDCIYSFHAYYNRRSEPLAYFVGRKVRTYPEDSGTSTYLELVREPEVVRLGTEILNAMKFVGPVKIDFKKDVRRNRFCLLEVNARYNLWHYLGAASGVNIPRTAYADLTGRRCPPATVYQTRIRWLSFFDDFRTFIRDYHPAGSLTWWQWLSFCRYPKVYDVFSWSDPWPLFFNLANYVKGVFRRSLKRYREVPHSS